jgi:hypothetical protein
VLAGVRAFRRERSDLAFHDGARFEQIAQDDGAGAGGAQGGEDRRIQRVPAFGRRDPRARAVADLHESLLAQHAQRFAHDRARHAEPRAHLGLRGQQAAGSELAAHDHRDQRIDEVRVESPRGGDRIHTSAGVV